MTRTHHTSTVPEAAGVIHKQQKIWDEATIETGGTVHRDALQFMHGKLGNAPVGVEATEKYRAALARTYARIAECLERHYIRCMLVYLISRRCI